MRKFFFAAVVAVAGLLASVSSADAAFRLRVESGTTTGPGVVLTDDAAGDVLPGAPNEIGFVGTIGQFSLTFTAGVKTPFAPLPGFYEGMDLNNISINTGGAGTLRLILESNDFGANTPDGILTQLVNTIGGVLTAPAGSTISSVTYLTDLDGEMPNFGADVIVPGVIAAIPGAGAGSIGHSAVSTPLVSSGPGGFALSSTASFTKTGQYSIYNVVTVTFTGAGTVSFDSVSATTPAPAGLLLALTGAPVLGIGAWIRRRRTAVAA